jgi:hypothetical protein
VAAIIVGLVSSFVVPAASATTFLRAQNGVRVIAPPAAQIVGAHEDIPAGESRQRAPAYDQTSVGWCVASETEGALAKFDPELAVSQGEAAIKTPYVLAV